MILLKRVLPILVLFSLSMCTVFQRKIKKPVIVAIPDSISDITLSEKTDGIKYSANLTNSAVAKRFLAGFKKEGQSISNITLTRDTANADFIIKNIAITLYETTRIEKVENAKSAYNGQDVALNSVGCEVELEIYYKDNKKLKNCVNWKSRREKLKHNRTAVDIVDGTNRNRSVYRTKFLSDDICTDLIDDVSKRIWTPVTRRVAKTIK